MSFGGLDTIRTLHPEMFTEEARRRFQRKVVVDVSGCWLWTGYVNPNGYGLEGHLYAHRVALALAGTVVGQRAVDHKCRVRRCVNPEHLRLASWRENLLADDSRSRPKENVDKTHCYKGHPLVAGNLQVSLLRKGHRRCLTCKHEYEARYWREKLGPAARARRVSGGACL